MMTTVNDVLTSRVRILLRDTDDGGILWTDEELIEWLNEGCLEVARIRPAASSSTIQFNPTAGALQTLPSSAIVLLEVICNHNAGVEGRVIRRVERKDLDNEMPNWRFSTPNDVALRYAPSKTDLRTFHVYPPSTGSATSGIILVASVSPDQATALVDEFPLEDIYAAVVANYVLYRAFHKQIESPASQSRAAEFLQMFNAQMGLTDQRLETRGASERQPTPR